MPRGKFMAFCRNCGAPLEDENIQCSQCGAVAGQHYQAVPYMPPPVSSPDDDVGKVLGIVALIIMIVIIVTVILAAVLYVMVIGMGGPGVGHSTPVGSWNSMLATSSTSGEITFGSFSGDVATSDIQIFVRQNGTDAGYILWTGDASAITVDMNWVGGPPGMSAEYTDYNMAGGLINQGDYITFNNLDPDTTYTFEVFHIPTDSTITMRGSNSFTTDP